ncbi:MAG: 16S rRNA (adenine(1518)-N(6)/adenine(1519)-N(6))-dimethyltransferase RsmA [Candidatus Doudnabacteria bacterium]|nr:16S rRNA (adenine(1518)-N(6)/adenine(1519)-N(6))-dimethyltransferase RsmA [Candidatus Doudnabacteria bacterium]
MNQLTTPTFIKDLFRHYHIKPKDYLGQNFLVDEIALQDIIDAGDLKKTDTVVEVGPGLGVLTQELAKKAGNVIAIEKDRTMLEILDVNLKDYKNIKVYNQDVLRFNVDTNLKGQYKVVANIPYYLTSHLFQYFLGQRNKPELMVFLVQKEVGERVTAKPGDMSVLAVSVQLYSDPEIIAKVDKKSFWPSPKVDSVVLKIIPKKKYPEIADEKEFFKIVKVGFSSKRKQIHNNLTNGLNLDAKIVEQWLSQNQIDFKSRAQDLRIEDWVKLYESIPK